MNSVRTHEDRSDTRKMGMVYSRYRRRGTLLTSRSAWLDRACLCGTYGLTIVSYSLKEGRPISRLLVSILTFSSHFHTRPASQILFALSRQRGRSLRCAISIHAQRGQWPGPEEGKRTLWVARGENGIYPALVGDRRVCALITDRVSELGGILVIEDCIVGRHGTSVRPLRTSRVGMDLGRRSCWRAFNGIQTIRLKHPVRIYSRSSKSPQSGMSAVEGVVLARVKR
jgi:hypothetical protein